MKLALRLGRTVRELLASIDGRELTMWRAFDVVEPIGDSRMDLGFGVVASAVGNFAGKVRAPSAEALRPVDFMPLAERPKSQIGSLAARVRSFLKSRPSRKA